MLIKLEWLGYRVVKNYDDIGLLSRFYLIPERYGRTDLLYQRRAIISAPAVLPSSLSPSRKTLRCAPSMHTHYRGNTSVTAVLPTSPSPCSCLVWSCCWWAPGHGDCPVASSKPSDQRQSREGPTTESAEPVTWYGQVMSSTVVSQQHLLLWSL